MKKKDNTALVALACIAGLYLLTRKQKPNYRLYADFNTKFNGRGNVFDADTDVTTKPFDPNNFGGTAVRSLGAMTDSIPTIENLKRGIQNGWYNAEITVVDGKQAVKLSGKLTDGKPFSDVYPISNEIAAELRKIGVK